MGTIFLKNITTAEQKVILRKMIFSFFNDEPDYYFDGTIEYNYKVENRNEYEYDKPPKLIITEFNLKIDITKTNTKILIKARQEADMEKE